MQFADIKNDIAFRKIFGNENKKETSSIETLLTLVRYLMLRDGTAVSMSIRFSMMLDIIEDSVSSLSDTVSGNIFTFDTTSNNDDAVHRRQTSFYEPKLNIFRLNRVSKRFFME